MKLISFLINVKNEENRLWYILGCAQKWADEIVVVDKGSTDNTVQIAMSYGAKVFVDADHNRYGDEDREKWVTFPENDWIYIGTPSEIPTVKCIQECKRLVEGDYDLITVPRKMYMLGIHSKYSPWYVSHYKFLINRKYTNVSNKIHHNFSSSRARVGSVEYAEDCCVYHLTYTSGAYWLRTMIDYWAMEAEGSTNVEADIQKAYASITARDKLLEQGGQETALLRIAWNLYHLGTAFCLEEKRRGMDINKVYKAIQDKLMEEWDNAT